MVVAICCLILGIVLIVIRKQSASPTTIIIIGSIFIAIGILAVYQEFTGGTHVTEILLSWLIGGSFGGLIFWAGIRSIYEKIFCCTEKIDGVFLSLRKYKGNKGAVSYAPVFSYRFENRDYEAVCMDRYGKRRMTRKYEVGKVYPIYISPKSPKRLVISRVPRLSEFFMVWFGAICIGTVIWITF